MSPRLSPLSSLLYLHGIPAPGRHVLVLVLAVLSVGSEAAAQAGPDASPCTASFDTTLGNRSDLYCFDLIPTPDVLDAAGVVEMGRVPSPFGVAVTAEGHHRYRLSLSAEGLPEPAALGPYTTYVAWVTTPFLDPMVKLGPVTNGRTLLGEVAFNKFLVFVTAEASAEGAERTGRLVLRGRSPSSLMESHDLVILAPVAVFPSAPGDAAGGGHGTHGHGTPNAGWSMPPMHPAVPMVPGMMGLTPQATPFLPDPNADAPEARPRERVTLTDGDTLRLEAGLVRRTIRGRRLVMYGFNGQYPGPLLHVPQAATVVVEFTNRTNWPTAVHWHGVRLDNRFDGVPGVTQDPVLPEESFTYRVFFRDAGLYWYHPHHREDVQQDLGLYGNMLVQPADPAFYGPANREEVLMLDDLLLGNEGLIPYGTESANYMMMGRFGNVFLVNGEPDYALTVRRGAVVRFFLTNVANTRTFNLAFGDAAVKVVASDVGRFEREAWAESVVIAPAERYVVDVRFDTPGTVALTTRVQAVNHRFGRFFSEVDTLALVHVADEPVAEDHADAFRKLREHADVQADVDRYRPLFDRPVDHELTLTLEVDSLPPVVQQMMRLDRVYFNPVEWGDTMPMMNWISTGREIHWTLRDGHTGDENMAVDWRFKVGDVVKIRLHNDRDAFHAMQHPFHIHGQRFLVLSVDGVPNDNLVWKDTVLLPVGATADLLLELSNPGRWMAHCHIAEHLESGMKMVFTVDP